jgi:hypothetical protein
MANTIDEDAELSSLYFEGVKGQILDALFNAIDNLDAVSVTIINAAAAAIDAAIATVDLTSQDSIARVQAVLNDISNQAQDDLYNYWRKVKDKLDEDATDSELMAYAIKKDISDALDKYTSEIHDGVTTIVEKVTPPSTTSTVVVTPSATEPPLGAWDAIKAIPAILSGAGKSIALFGKLAELADLMHSPDDALKMMRQLADKDPDEVIDSGTKAAIRAGSVIGFAVGAPLGFLPSIMDAYSPGLGENIRNISRSLYHPTRLGISELAAALVRGNITLEKFYLDSADLGFSTQNADEYVKLARLMIPAADLITLRLRGELTDDELDYRLSELGLIPEDVTKFKALARQMLPVDNLVSLWLRGELTNDEFNLRLSELGISKQDTDDLKKLAWQIPQVNDLIHMAVREAFTPEIARAFGQYEDYPEAVTEWAEKQGLSEDWAKRYWAAHWELPSADMGFAMFQRGIIDMPTLKMLLRALDVMPYWRDQLIKLAYQPITRVDIRRMHKLMGKDHAWLVQRYGFIGYSPEDAEEHAIFTEELNKEEAKLEKQAERDLTASEIANAYANSAIGESDATTMLSDLGYDVAEIALKLTLAELPVLKRIRDKKVAIINQRLLYGAIDLNGAVDALNALDMPTREMEFVLADWQLDLELQELKAEAKRAK